MFRRFLSSEKGFATFVATFFILSSFTGYFVGQWFNKGPVNDDEIYNVADEICCFIKEEFKSGKDIENIIATANKVGSKYNLKVSYTATFSGGYEIMIFMILPDRVVDISSFNVLEV